MAWVTVPALIGPVIGPPLGGFITTYFSWHWIFLINIPIGLLGIFLALNYIDPIRSENPERFDLYGLVLAGVGLGGIAFGLSVAGLNLLPWTVIVALVGIGIGFDDALCHPRQANRLAGAGFHAACGCRRCAPASSAASCFGSASARCRSCCRC